HCSPSSKDIKLFQKKKEEKDKALLSEHHSMRISQALSLMNEMLSETVVLPANERRPLSRIRSPQEYRKRHMASTKGVWTLLLLWFFCHCRGHPKTPVLSERSRIAAKPSFGQKVHRFTPALGFPQSRGKNRTF
ncbi:CPLN1 protein, partial [Pluvianellus socialis]|nr:CPLN1 protein [Pluvianellus socialis]